MQLLIRRIVILVIGAALLGSCTDSGVDEAAPESGGRSTTTVPAAGPAMRSTTTVGGPTPSIKASYGCAPNDATQITVSGDHVGNEKVVVQVLHDGTVYNWSYAQTGPRVGAVFQPRLPKEAYDVGTAQARIVTTEVPSETIVETSFSLEMDHGGCG